MRGDLNAIFTLLTDILPDTGIRLLLIGGHAVNFHGVTRATRDVDFILAAEDEPRFHRALTGAVFTDYAANETVAVFHHPGSKYRIDALKVDRDTLDELLGRSERMTVAPGKSLPVPALPDLIAMKLAAIRNQPNRRKLRDLPDIARLVHLHNLSDDAVKKLCGRYGPPGIFQELRRASGTEDLT